MARTRLTTSTWTRTRHKTSTSEASTSLVARTRTSTSSKGSTSKSTRITNGLPLVSLVRVLVLLVLHLVLEQLVVVIGILMARILLVVDPNGKYY